jgi:hypothetical protein
MKIRKGGIVAIAFERRLRLPLHENQDLSRRNVSGHFPAELAQGDDSATVRASTSAADRRLYAR